jgi:D-beta-D-heptose 7-phosphate kinase/D-beta-D-heptose 1-phosphate adenosyltransferase
VSKGAQLMHNLDLGALPVTRGEHGMTLLKLVTMPPPDAD